MDATELMRLIAQEEGIKLDFKQQYELKHADQKVRAANWNELVKDILALTNGNVGLSNQVGYLIIGAGDDLMPGGTRQLFDVHKQGLTLNRKQLIEKVNAHCHPPLVDLAYSEVEINGTWLAVIEIPSSPFVHETTRRLETFKSTYNEGTIFIRRTEGIYPATQPERDALLHEKQHLKKHIPLENLTDIEVRYRQHLIVQHRELDFQGLMQTARPLALPLKDIFISLHAVGDVPETDTMLSESTETSDFSDNDNVLISNEDHVEQVRSVQQATRPKRQNIAEILARDVACVILGEPGAGKTTILRYVTLALAEDEAEQKLLLKGKRLPILVPLASYEAALRSDDTITPNVYLAGYYEQEHGLEGISALFEHYLRRGEAVILFDGLDEVLTQEKRTLIARRVKTFIDVATNQGNKVVVTSRIVGYREAPLPGSLPHFTVLRFNKEEIEQFVERWCHTYEAWLANEDSAEIQHKGLVQSQQLLEAIHSNPGIDNLASNPLLLTILALIHRQEKKLPHRRVELYEIYVRTLIERWGRARSLSGRTISNLSLDYYKVVKILAPLALWMQRERASITVRRIEIVRRIKSTLEKMGYESIDAADEAERLLDDLRRYSGLLVERGRDAYGFMHLTFQEYFAARAIAMIQPGERSKIFHGNLHDPRWREVILLTAGQIGNVDLREEEVSEFVKNILNANSWGNAYTHHDTFLAASCLADEVSLDVSTTREIIDQLGLLLNGNFRLLANLAANYLTQCLSPSTRRRIVSILTSALSCEYSWSRRAAAEALGKIGQQEDEVIEALLICLDDEDNHVRQSSAYALGELGKPTKPLLDKLSEVEKLIGFGATKALRHLLKIRTERRLKIPQKVFLPHEEKIKELTGVDPGQKINFDELSDHNLLKLLDFGGYRNEALLTLIRRKTLKEDILQQIIIRLTRYGRYARRDYYKAFIPVSYCNPEIIESLIAETRSSKWQVRQAAIRALGKLGRENLETLDIFLDTLANAKWQIKQASARAIGEFGKSSQSIDSALLTATNHRRWEVRQAAVRSLGQVGTCTQSVANRLVEALADEIWLVRWTAFKVLPEYEKRCKDVVDELIRAVVNHPSIEARHSATCLIGEIRHTTPQTVAAILKATHDQSEVVRQAAVAVLGELGQWNTDVHNALQEALDDTSLDVKGNATSALLAFEVKDSTLEMNLVDALTNTKRQRVQEASIRALSKVDNPSPAAISALLQHVKKNYYWYPDDKEPEIQALSEIGQKDLPHFLEICQQLKFTEEEKQIIIPLVLEILTRTQKICDRIRKTLLALVKSKEWDLRAFAATALAYNNQEDEEVTTQLKLLLTDEDVRVRDAATYALSHIAGSSYLEEIASQPCVWIEPLYIYEIPF